MTEACIFDAVRTPRGKGKKDGGLHQATPVWLLRTLLQALQARSGLDTARVDDVVLGCVTPVGEQGADIARTAVLDAGWAQSVAGVTLSRFCASGLEAANLAAAKIMSGMEDMVVAGGVESMSRWAMGSDGGAWVMDPRVNSGTAFVPQGISADLVATLEGFGRGDLDAYAAESHRRAAHAQAQGYFARSIVPVTDLNGRLLLDRDETVRPGASVESLAQIGAAFETMGAMGFDATALDKYTTIEKIHHHHHAGNSSGIVDGAALLLMGSKAAGEQAGLKPRARVRAFAVTGTEPTIMLTGPTPAVRKALAKAGMAASDIDLWEINEAFATVPMKTARDLGVSLDRVNVNGGSIAMGHPLGATGAILLGTALDELERTGQSTALATLCVGAGMGIATIIERV
ncbi:acetyl-CoA C-acetyltransferase [Burkholderia lata]|uniref:3-ketoacyl-CoA thiolase n=1 Tax=Burkholderia lata (strain ATCC 17760 / DSM 23089 / LMG 22485 / NCIMB 9086 / R18194 / 383) TaxID=482957 RepID=A0A6P2TR49_BURL3|nr:acetyl-CoA C-acetyltransferase [Burkholderia lata]VWB07783.1 3-ketoacyl-CoA thiolase [Burkholderia lata]VWB20784.1 3-ketoacyl-CoA thiolase [Burkholderia lata]VWC66430.1 3-ketoacyl-CoA thiolase [Burkholderia lata]